MSPRPLARPIRSLLFAPANRPELIEKFPRYRADVFAIDLEDGTPEAEKASARRALPRVIDALRTGGVSGEVYVRTNESRSPHASADLAAALSTPIDGVIMPKLAAAADLERFSQALSDAEARTGRPLRLIGMIETAAGALRVDAIASCGDAHLSALAFGAEDFITELGGRRTVQGLEVLYARSRVVLAARAAGLDAIDQVFVNIRDDEGFRRDAQMGRELGYGGKMCLVPKQTVIANEVFSPSPEEIERSRRLIEASGAAQSSGRGAIEFEGGMVDEPLIRRARAIVRLANDLVSRNRDT